MLRKALFLALILVGTVVSAQDSRVNVIDTDAMIQKANERTELVHETVELKEEQRDAVLEVYMWQERQIEAMKQRYKGASEDYEADVKHMYKRWDHMVSEKLKTVLTDQQMAKWIEALK